MKVCKFGGTSVATAEQIKKVVAIIMEDPQRKVVVVSAPGKRFSDDIKVTDLLILLGEKALAGQDFSQELDEVILRYRAIAEGLLMDKGIINLIEQDLRARLAQDKNDPILFMDTIKAAGEDNNAKLVATYLQSLGVQAKYVSPKEGGLLVNDRPERVRALPEGDVQLARLREEEGIVVFPGFFGFTKDGTLRTFNRGGSDITGSLLAAATSAELYENFTDVDSVFTANPKVIESPVGIKEMTYREMRELAYAGFTVFHEEALLPAFNRSIPVCIKNTNNPSAPGTMIVKERKNNANPVVGIAADHGFSTLFVEKYLMNLEVGFGRRLLQILEEEGIPFEHTPSGIDSLSVIIKDQFLTPEKETRIVQQVIERLHPDDVHFRKGFSMIMVVGEGMQNARGLAARATAAIARSGANIEMINQGSSEVSIAFGILQEDEAKVLKELYNEFFVNVYVNH